MVYLIHDPAWHWLRRQRQTHVWLSRPRWMASRTAADTRRAIMFGRVGVGVGVGVRACVCECVCVHVYICMYICTYICTYVLYKSIGGRYSSCEYPVCPRSCNYCSVDDVGCVDDDARLAEITTFAGPSSSALEHQPHLRRDLLARICAGTGLTPCHICTGTGLGPATPAPGLTRPHLHRDWAHPTTSAPGLGSLPCHICAGTPWISGSAQAST